MNHTTAMAMLDRVCAAREAQRNSQQQADPVPGWTGGGFVPRASTYGGATGVPGIPASSTGFVPPSDTYNGATGVPGVPASSTGFVPPSDTYNGATGQNAAASGVFPAQIPCIPRSSADRMCRTPDFTCMNVKNPSVIDNCPGQTAKNRVWCATATGDLQFGCYDTNKSLLTATKSDFKLAQ